MRQDDGEAGMEKRRPVFCVREKGKDVCAVTARKGMELCAVSARKK